MSNLFILNAAAAEKLVSNGLPVKEGQTIQFGTGVKRSIGGTSYIPESDNQAVFGACATEAPNDTYRTASLQANGKKGDTATLTITTRNGSIFKYKPRTYIVKVTIV